MRIDLSGLIGGGGKSVWLELIDCKRLKKSLSFSGPFSGAVSIEASVPPATNVPLATSIPPATTIDGERIQSISLVLGRAEFRLSVPVPVKFEQQSKIELLLIYASGTDTWTVELTAVKWFRHAHNAKANLGEWLRDVKQNRPTVLKTKRKRGFPIDHWGLAISPMNWAARQRNCGLLDWFGLEFSPIRWVTRGASFIHVLNAGVFAPISGRWMLVLVPEANRPYMWDVVSPGLNLFGLKNAALGSKSVEWRLAPLALAFPLHTPRHAAMWRGLVSWAPVQTVENRKNDERLKVQPILEVVWNQPARQALLGARIESAASPMVALPLLTVTEERYGHSLEKQAPLLFVDAPLNELADQPGQPRLRRVFLSGFEKKIEIKAEFPLHANVTTEADSGVNLWMMRFCGTIDDPLPLIPTDVKAAGETREYFRKALDAALAKVENSTSEDLLLAWVATGKMERPKDSDGWVVWGSLQFQTSDEKDTSVLECNVRGRWTADACDAYPEVILTMRGCQVRPSASADAAGRDLFAAFGVKSGIDDDLQRDSDVLRFPLGGAQQPRKCDITIRHRTDRGRIAVSRVEVRTTDQSRFGDESVVLQLRPFAVAVVQPPDIDAEAGELIAVWSSSDPEGMQWRVPDATATVTLPPQAVGEAMERGARFWKTGALPESWIDPDNPIAYRFSPPTQLVVRPSLRERRYNKLPTNFSALMVD